MGPVDTCARAAREGQYCSGHVPVGDPGTSRHVIKQQKGGHLEVLQWAYAKGCPLG